METGPKQHIVPQQMIRRFANSQNELRGLDKSTLKILRRRFRPKAILWKENYYKDLASDLDADWLTPIEQRFAKYYPRLADEPWTEVCAPTEEGEAFVDWTISQLCRTDFLQNATTNLLPNHDPLIQVAYLLRPTLIQNEIRRGLFEHLKEVYTQPLWKWKVFIVSADDEFILTDHPVCTTANNSELGHAVFVPISRKRMIFGGGIKSLELLDRVPVSRINCHLAAWAKKWIYASEEETLRRVVLELDGNGSMTDPHWRERARKPLFGKLEEATLSSDSIDIFDEMKRCYSVETNDDPSA